jgi:uncharacterized protein YndB with AHSA1/START domain
MVPLCSPRAKPSCASRVRLTFAEEGGKTTLTMPARVVKLTAKAAPYLAGMEVGWTQSLERLEAHLAKV